MTHSQRRNCTARDRLERDNLGGAWIRCLVMLSLVRHHFGAEEVANHVIDVIVSGLRGTVVSLSQLAQEDGRTPLDAIHHHPGLELDVFEEKVYRELGLEML